MKNAAKRRFIIYVQKSVSIQPSTSPPKQLQNLLILLRLLMAHVRVGARGEARGEGLRGAGLHRRVAGERRREVPRGHLPVPKCWDANEEPYFIL